MRLFFTRQLATGTALAFLAATAVQAQHTDVLLQIVDGKIATGSANLDDNTWLLGQNVFERQLLSNFRANDPGFTALGTGSPLLPPGASGFAPQTELFVDIVPSTVGGERANYWYWDGIDGDSNGLTIDDVDFGFGPAGVTWNVFDDNFDLHTADGSDAVVADIFVQNAFSDGAIHQHLLMQIADGDGNSGTSPPQGVFLASFVAKADGYEDSDPFFFVQRTSGLTNSERDLAAEWARLNYENLIRLPGDYNADGLVDEADYALWQTDFGSSADPAGTGADGNVDGRIDAADFTIWRDQYNETMATAATVPEPSSFLLMAGFASLFLHRLRRLQRGS